MTHIQNLFLAAAVTLLISCSDKSPHWDAAENTYYIPAHEISISMPDDIEWEIADNSRLPDDILFFGVNLELSLCTVVTCQPGFNNKSDIHDYPEKYFEAVIAKASQQQNVTDVDYSKPSITKSRYGDRNAIRFQQNVRLDSIEISYEGVYLSHNSKVYGIISIEPSPVDSLSHVIAQKSINGFNFYKP